MADTGFPLYLFSLTLYPDAKKDAASIPDAIKGEYLKRRFYQLI